MTRLYITGTDQKVAALLSAISGNVEENSVTVGQLLAARAIENSKLNWDDRQTALGAIPNGQQCASFELFGLGALSLGAHTIINELGRDHVAGSFPSNSEGAVRLIASQLFEKMSVVLPFPVLDGLGVQWS